MPSEAESPLQQVARIQTTLEGFAYNPNGASYNVDKKRPLWKLLATGAEILRSPLRPIQCVEGVLAALSLSQRFQSIQRFGLSFQSQEGDKLHYHLVLGVWAEGKYGAIGISRNPHLMNKPLTFTSLAPLISDFRKAYEECGHTLLSVTVGRSITHHTYVHPIVTWGYLRFLVSDWDLVEKYCAQYHERLVADSESLWKLPFDPPSEPIPEKPQKRNTAHSPSPPHTPTQVRSPSGALRGRTPNMKPSPPCKNASPGAARGSSPCLRSPRRQASPRRDKSPPSSRVALLQEGAPAGIASLLVMEKETSQAEPEPEVIEVRPVLATPRMGIETPDCFVSRECNPVYFGFVSCNAKPLHQEITTPRVEFLPVISPILSTPPRTPPSFVTLIPTSPPQKPSRLQLDEPGSPQLPGTVPNTSRPTTCHVPVPVESRRRGHSVGRERNDGPTPETPGCLSRQRRRSMLSVATEPLQKLLRSARKYSKVNPTDAPLEKAKKPALDCEEREKRVRIMIEERASWLEIVREQLGVWYSQTWHPDVKAAHYLRSVQCNWAGSHMVHSLHDSQSEVNLTDCHFTDHGCSDLPSIVCFHVPRTPIPESDFGPLSTAFFRMRGALPESPQKETARPFVLRSSAPEQNLDMVECELFFNLSVEIEHIYCQCEARFVELYGASTGGKRLFLCASRPTDAPGEQLTHFDLRRRAGMPLHVYSPLILRLQPRAVQPVASKHGSVGISISTVHFFLSSSRPPGWSSTGLIVTPTNPHIRERVFDRVLSTTGASLDRVRVCTN
eukprot:TRINITY_DN67173_c0_g1_i1.p1 TRINITY_DN67173_c0_g1~~TRINITY_DN67173_c0_g1_i1.p1  ORF type:complete len:785 (+),score=49.87 TRINITY_DN67173_c0_g1_i1:81-2435(+)